VRPRLLPSTVLRGAEEGQAGDGQQSGEERAPRSSRPLTITWGHNWVEYSRSPILSSKRVIPDPQASHTGKAGCGHVPSAPDAAAAPMSVRCRRGYSCDIGEALASQGGRGPLCRRRVADAMWRAFRR
jgi:hypothetical protein